MEKDLYETTVYRQCHFPGGRSSAGSQLLCQPTAQDLSASDLHQPGALPLLHRARCLVGRGYLAAFLAAFLSDHPQKIQLPSDDPLFSRRPVARNFGQQPRIDRPAARHRRRTIYSLHLFRQKDQKHQAEYSDQY